MTDEELAAQYEALRAAAADVVHSALRYRYPAPYTPAMDTLHRVLLDSRPPSEVASASSVQDGTGGPDDAPDPARYSLAFTDYRDDGSSGPYELTKLAAEIRADLDGDRIRGEHLVNQPLRDVTMTQLRAMVISGLLDELAARLVPGPAVGTADTGRDLAAIAVEFSKRLLNQTSAGE